MLVSLDNIQYDLALLRHVIYYFAKDEWISIANRLYENLAPGGKLIFTYHRYDGQVLNLIEHFGEKPLLDFCTFEKDCEMHFGEDKVKLYFTTSSVVASYPEDMAHMCSIFFSDNNMLVPSVDVIKIIKNWYVPDRDLYVLQMCDASLVISKPL